jgi:hypothetical protein
VGQTALQRNLNKELAERAWISYCNCVPQYVIAKQLQVSEGTVSRWIKRRQETHPAASMSAEALQVDAFESLRSAGLMLRQEAAGYRERGEPIPPGLLSLVSIHSDRFSRWASRLSAVPQVAVEVNADFNDGLWRNLLGASAPMADAAVVEALPEAAVDAQPVPCNNPTDRGEELQ